MKANSNLHKAKTVKNDEFYTQLTDIEKEMYHYRDHFKDKVIFCNCDDPLESKFYFFFAQNFEFLGLKKLISTHFEKDIPSYKLELLHDVNNDGKIDVLDTIKTPLKQNGDFRSPECIAILEEADIVITNPPFSLFREYVKQLMDYEKKFLIVGSMNAITYKEIFPLLKDNLLWLGNGSPKTFKQPDGSLKAFGNILWYTNLDYLKRHEDLLLFREYDPDEYPTYDNYDAINVDKVKDIPMDYPGAIGVPITFLTKHNPNQFELIGIDRPLVEKTTGKSSRFKIDSKEKFARIVIRNKKL